LLGNEKTNGKASSRKMPEKLPKKYLQTWKFLGSKEIAAWCVMNASAVLEEDGRQANFPSPFQLQAAAAHTHTHICACGTFVFVFCRRENRFHQINLLHGISNIRIFPCSEGVEDKVNWGKGIATKTTTTRQHLILNE